MVKNNCFYFIFLCLLGLTTYAQKVSNISFRQDKSNIIVSYDLETKTPCKVNLFVSTNGGTTWQGPLTKVSGDVGAKIASGSHSITWNVLEELEELRGDKIQFQLRADGDTVATVKNNTPVWNTKNLNVSKYKNGDVIPEVKDPKEWAKLTKGAWCYYKNDPKNGAIYGKLYNWYAVNDPRGLAPEGFHLPTNTELRSLTNLKDTSGYASLPGGYRNYDGTFYSIGKVGSWWIFSRNDVTIGAWYSYLNFNSGFESSYQGSDTNGFSVRCIKD